MGDENFSTPLSVYTEISISFKRIEEVENAIAALDIRVLEMPREALFLTRKAFLAYKKIKRDVSKYKTYFPQVKLIHPEG